MLIKDTRKKVCSFENVSIGECFIYKDEPYMATENTVVEALCDCYTSIDVLNALNLKNGLLYHVNDEVIVEPIKAEITIF